LEGNPQNIEQFIESKKNQYAMEKGLQAGNEYTKIVAPYVNKIISLELQITELTKQLPKKQRVKLVKKGKKNGS
jgi:hypothetical protein